MSYRPKQGVVTNTRFLVYSCRQPGPMFKKYWSLRDSFWPCNHRGIAGALKAALRWATTKGPYDNHIIEKRVYKIITTTVTTRIV